jgi:hypothetical protein
MIFFHFIQGVSEIRVLILTSERTRQFMKLFSITFCKIRKSIPRFFAPQFLPNESFCVINYAVSIFCNHENLNFDYLFFSVTMELFNKALFLSQQKIFALTHGRVYTLMVNLFQILNQFVLLFRKNVIEKSSMIWRVLPLVKINTRISETPCISWYSSFKRIKELNFLQNVLENVSKLHLMFFRWKICNMYF